MWLDTGLFSVILFSAIDHEFMGEERGGFIRRPVISATTLPLLTHEESIEMLNNCITATYVDREGELVDRADVIDRLAYISGGHPESIVTLSNKCNEGQRLFWMTYENEGTKTVKEIVKEAGLLQSFWRYSGSANFQGVLDLVLLGGTVRRETRQSGD